MTLIAEATREELEQALEALDVDDPYKPFKEALKAGKRVRCDGWVWLAKGDHVHWDFPPEAYEIEPDQPTLYCGHTAQEWQFVIDGKFDVRVSNKSIDKAKCLVEKYRLRELLVESEFPFKCAAAWRYCYIVRRKNHPQPTFGSKANDEDSVLVHYKNAGLFFSQANTVTWEEIDWFINLSRDG